VAENDIDAAIMEKVRELELLDKIDAASSTLSGNHHHLCRHTLLGLIS
jgi:hypothetical protein